MTRPRTADRGPVRQRLIAAREARGLDRAQAAAGAGISLRYLTMLEEGEYPLVSDPAYLSPFIRRYATFLELPAEDTVVAFLSETEVAERVAAASVSLPTVTSADEREGRGHGLMIAAGAIAITVGVAAAFLDLPTAPGWLESFRPSVESFGGTVDHTAASVGRFVTRTRESVGSWIAGETPSSPIERSGSPVEVASSDPPPTFDSLAAVPTEMPASTMPTKAPAPPSAVEPAEPPVPAASPPMPAPTVPAATTPIQLSEVIPPAVPTPEAAHPRDPHRLELLATARQVFVWATVDGGEPREVELRRGETASFEARRELLLTIDDAGGVLATLNGKRLPPLGASGFGKRNIRIPLAADGPRRSASR
jgi:cytoskeleton protein RodZ